MSIESSSRSTRAGSFGSLAWLAAAALAIAAPSAANALPYFATVTPNQPYQPLPIGGGTANVLGSGTDTSFIFNMPPGFTYKFYGQTYSSINVGTNGYVTFNPGNNGNLWNSWTFPSQSAPKDILAVWWYWSRCPNPDAIKTQVIGTQPSRQVVIQWRCQCWSPSNGDWEAQLWLFEGSSTMKVHYGQYPTMSDYSQVTVGVQDQTASTYTNPLSCGASCTGNNWPTNTTILYSQGPELSVTQVTAPEEGFAGLPVAVTATVRNIGGEAANDFTTEFWVSPVPAITVDSMPLGTVAERQSANPSTSVTFSMNPALPITLDPGMYYILAVADPDRAVPLNNRATTIGASPPFMVGVPAPNLSAPRVVVPDTVEPGAPFTVSWTAANTGNAPAVHAPYDIVLSTHESPGPASFVLHRGIVDVDKLSVTEVDDEIVLPADIPTGTYWVGVILDPDMVVYEHDKSNNVGVSNMMRVASPSTLAIVTDPNLPEGELGARYEIAMEAIGGDGVYHWSVAGGSRLPPGLSLEESPPGARDAGMPFVTLLTGSPNLLGDFDFELKVESGGASKRQVFLLHVDVMNVPLTINSRILPDGNFRSEYDVRLAASGGTAPYTWSLDAGFLPGGILLSSSGILAGRPMEDGPFSFTVRVTDAVGTSQVADFSMTVMPPSRISCGSEELPAHRINQPYEGVRLHAAGGSQPTWSNNAVYYLADSPAEKWEWRQFEAPPGLTLGQDGRVTGTPTRAGVYDWYVDIRDAKGNASDVTTCPIRVEVLRDQNLSILTQALPDAVVGQRYAAQLESFGGEGEVVWSIGGSEKLPAGLTISPEGLVAGTPTGEELGGESAGSVAFMVRASDTHNRFDVAPLSVTLFALPPGAGPVEEVKEKVSCQSAGSEPSLLLVAAALGLAAIRRRR